MAVSTTLQLMTEHGLDVKKGWFDMASLDFSASLDSSVTDDVPRGRVVYVNSAGNFVPGVSQKGVAIFLLNGSSDADVSNPGTTAAGNFMHQAVAPTGKLSGLVATGGYEIASTEFDATQTYVPGDLLSADTNGVLTNNGVVQYDDPVVGVVSSGSASADPAKNHNGIASLSFWSVYLPGSTSWSA
jgi:hypothetical protein